MTEVCQIVKYTPILHPKVYLPLCDAVDLVQYHVGKHSLSRSLKGTYVFEFLTYTETEVIINKISWTIICLINNNL